MSVDRYCIDTSALIHAWRRSYPIKNFPSVWDRIGDLIRDGRLLSSTEVLHELKKKDDSLFDWAKEQEEMFIDIEDDRLQIRLTQILADYPRLVDTRKSRSTADPFVIALASLNSSPLIVVSQEGATGKIERPNMPDVCAAEGISCIEILDLIIREGWRFG